MYGVARLVLGQARRLDAVDDVVQQAIVSLMGSPPTAVRSWEAIMVTAVKRRAIDYLRSAAVIYSGPEFEERHDRPTDEDLADDVAEFLDRRATAAVAREKVELLDPRMREVVWEYIIHEKARASVAERMNVSPGRISQMAKQALEELRDILKSEEENQ
jgi:RNA polymerase sigma-70 factor (ECF subfamily)